MGDVMCKVQCSADALHSTGYFAFDHGYDVNVRGRWMDGWKE